MNILLTRFPLESRYGGAEVQTLALMKGLRERGHTVAFLGSCPVLLDKVTNCKLQIAKLDIGIPPVSKTSAISFLWRRIIMKKKLLSAICNLQSSFCPDVVVMLSLSEKLLLTPFLYAQGIKVIWVEHDRVGRWLTHNPWLPRLRKLSKLATTIVVSDLSKRIYEKLGYENVVAIPNGIDMSRLEHGQKPEARSQKPEFHIGTIARLSKDKGVDILIDAIKDLPDVSLTIVGTGPEEGKLKAGSYKLEACSVLHHVDDLHAFYATLDLFILPSREHDPFGLVAGEAMMMGIPVIVTDACGIAGYLRSGEDAMIVSAGSVRDLHKAILDMQNDPKKRSQIGAAGKRSAEEQFSMGIMVQRYEEVLRQAP